MKNVNLGREILSRTGRVYQFIRGNLPKELSSKMLSVGSWHYLGGEGKGIRPALLMLCCGAAGGVEEEAVPAAAAVEVTHNWTLVHDDIMDRDQLRRGRPTAHVLLREKAVKEGMSPEEADHFGASMAMAAGDLMHAWAILLCAKSREQGVPLEVTLALVEGLERAIVEVVEGQALDLELSRVPLNEVDEGAVFEMMRKKTGSLLKFCAVAGAMIATRRVDEDFPEARALSEFARKCGLAFQIRDDILGLFGSEEEVGKPTGSDIEEGKRTLLVVKAFSSLDEKGRERLRVLLGRRGLTPAELDEFRQLVEESGSRAGVERMAVNLAGEAKRALEALPETQQREVLKALSDFVVARGR